MDQGYSLQEGFENQDFAAVTTMLAGTYWVPGIGQEEVMQGALNSALVLGVFDKKGEQVGFVRVVSDKTRFAYVLDMIVHQRHRKQGIATALMERILGHRSLRDVYHWLLITRDAHPLYARQGFHALEKPLNYMEIRKPRPEQ